MSTAQMSVILEMSAEEAEALSGLLRNVSWHKGLGPIYAEMWNELDSLGYSGHDFVASFDRSESELVVEELDTVIATDTDGSAPS